MVRRVTREQGAMKKRREQERRESMKAATAHGRRSVRPAAPVVGIGASAGGLEALEQFLKHVPVESGASFVVVQHLDPTHKGMLADLLQRVSALPVHQVTDGMRAEPGHVYVIPPNRDMSIVHGVLHLLVPVAPRGLRLPIDFFFRALAADLRSQSVGVLLSGMGADGTLGLRAIQENAGSTFVQSPASAKYDSMPRSAIDAGVADVVASAEELPGKIAEYLQRPRRLIRPKDSPPDREAQSGLEKIVGLLRSATGHDFSPYKSSTLHRRIERRMGLHQIDGMAPYIRYLRENPAEGELLFRELLIGVTAFFRDSADWERVRHDVLPRLLARCAPNDTLRAWVPACSTGEEAYSLGMVFKEALEQCTPAKNVRLQIFATDLERGAVERARQGHYPANIATDVSQERLIRFFVEEAGGYRIRKEIRELVIFATQNILQDPPFTKLDLLTCRNFLIYLTPEVQRNLIPLFHYSLVPGGVLFLGSAETTGTFKNLFEPLDGGAPLYRRLDAVGGMRTLLDSTFPRSGRGAAESPAVKPRAAAAKTSAVFSDAATYGRNAPATKGGRAPRGATEMAHVAQELQHAREELRTTREEMQTSAQELKSVNEEQQSSNEELQSANEELTTSKEEMQSMNEELQTLNHELLAKVDELSRAGNDMKNLLDSTEIAILFLDDALNVRRFTPQVTTIFKLIPSDVGRPLADLASDLAYSEIYDDAREVLGSLVITEKVAASLDGRRFRVRIMPYRTNDNRIDGVVITFTNVSAIETQSAKMSAE
jgi:chemotaxis methyl-accepting protein methylase